MHEGSSISQGFCCREAVNAESKRVSTVLFHICAQGKLKRLE